MTLSWFLKPMLDEQNEALKRGGEKERDVVFRQQAAAVTGAYVGMAKRYITSGGNPAMAVYGFIEGAAKGAVRHADKYGPK